MHEASLACRQVSSMSNKSQHCMQVQVLTMLRPCR